MTERSLGVVGRSTTWLWLGLCVGRFTAPVEAQTLRIQVVEEATGAPIEGAIVSLVPARGRPSIRGFSDGVGRITLTAPEPGVWRLRGDRIGYATASSDTIQLAAGASRSYRFVLPMTRVMLLELSVSAKPVCGRRRDADPTMAALWEEARKALVAVAVTRATSGSQFRMHAYAMELDRDLNVSIWMADSTWVTTSPRSFVAVPESTLRKFGFARVTGSDAWYYAPDDVVLLSDYFLETHCFRSVAAGDGSEELIGLRFTPRNQHPRADVTGTIWLRRRDAALRHLDFSYTGLFRPAPGARGRIEFARLPAGGWFVRKWCTRGPRWGRILGDGARLITPALTGYAETGGEAELVSPISSSEGESKPGPAGEPASAVPATTSTAAASSQSSSPCSTG